MSIPVRLRLVDLNSTIDAPRHRGPRFFYWYRKENRWPRPPRTRRRRIASGRRKRRLNWPWPTVIDSATQTGTRMLERITRCATRGLYRVRNRGDESGKICQVDTEISLTLNINRCHFFVGSEIVNLLFVQNIKINNTLKDFWYV